MWTSNDQDAADALEDCLREGGRTPCRGEVSRRHTTLGTAIFECREHMIESLDRAERDRERYPVEAPGWFDPAYAGERWDDDY
jgi:hypothetical protein